MLVTCSLKSNLCNLLIHGTMLFDLISVVYNRIWMLLTRSRWDVNTQTLYHWISQRCVVMVSRDRDRPTSKPVCCEIRGLCCTAQMNSVVLFCFPFVCHLMFLICNKMCSSYQLGNTSGGDTRPMQPLTKFSRTGRKNGRSLEHWSAKMHKCDNFRRGAL